MNASRHEDFGASIRCANLQKHFDGTAALDNLDLVLPQSGVVAILGPNGAGKTTLLDVITGFQRPDSGKVFLGEVELTRMPPDRIVRIGIARTFQELRLVRLASALDNIMLAQNASCTERFWKSLARLGVKAEERTNRKTALNMLGLVGLAGKSMNVAGSLSYGQQKLLTLACCLATNTRVMFLDEPIAGLDPSMADKALGLLSSVAAEGKLVVFIEHDIPSVKRIAEQVVVMDHGKVIASDKTDKVLALPEVLEAYVG